MLKQLDNIAGFSLRGDAPDQALVDTLHEAQSLRVFQSHRVLPLVLVTGAVYTYGLWDDAPRLNLILWIAIVTVLAVLRVLVCRRIQTTLEDLSLRQLYRNEIWLFATSIMSTTAVGAGYWMVCYSGTDRAVLAVTVFCCIYAIGTTINSSIVYRSFPPLLFTNLAQGIAFLALVRDPVDIEVAVGMAGILILLLEFGRRNSAVFSESIRMRDENRAQNLKLEEERLIVEQSLNAARAANDDKNRFLAAASHDLRQPLHAMTLFLGSLRSVVDSRLAYELIDKIDETSNILRDQFNSLLDLSKFDAGVVVPENSHFSLDILLANIVDGVRPDAMRKSLKMELISLPIDLETDMLLLERLLRNLIVNAVAYTESGKVAITIADRREGVFVSISDTGPGIAPQHQEKIFDDYYQLNNPARTKSKGTGLGLAIAKRICHVLDFKLTLTSTLGAGSKFTVFIPARQVFLRNVDRPADPTPRSESVPLDGLRILLVDDDPLILDALSRLLRIWQCEPVCAGSSKEVRAVLQSQADFDIAILDDMLDEEATGLDLARHLVQTMNRRRILLTTGNMMEERLEEIRDDGFQVLIKPVDHMLLRQALQEIVLSSASSEV